MTPFIINLTIPWHLETADLIGCFKNHAAAWHHVNNQKAHADYFLYHKDIPCHDI